ncbi:MAG: hypothetical protein AB9Q20_11230 [Candidatus Reddybacter sp.]
MGEIVCENCQCTLYSTGDGGSNGVTGELCGSCQEDKNHEDGLDDDEYYY